MVNMKTIIAAAVLAVAGIITFFWYFQGDDAKIKKQFKTISELAEKGSDEHELTAAVNAKRIGSMFADTCRIEIPSYNISRTYARADVPAHVLGARSRYSDISLKFYDLDIDFPEEKIARVTLTAYVEAVRVSGEAVREVHEIVCRLEKIEKDWLFDQIEVVSVLER